MTAQQTTYGVASPLFYFVTIILTSTAVLGCTDETQRGEVDMTSQEYSPKMEPRLREGGILDFESCSPPIHDEDLPKLKTLRDGTVFCFSNCLITDRGLAHLTAYDNMEAINLCGCEITGEGLSHLAKLPRLEEMTLWYTQFEDANADLLPQFPTLQYLDLSSTRITDATLSHMARMPKLQVLRLNDTHITDDGLRHLADCRELTELHLDETGITREGIGHLASCRKLRLLSLQYCELGDDIAPALAQIPELAHLNLRSTKITDRTLAVLATKARWESLGLTLTDVSDAGVESFAGQNEVRLFDVYGSEKVGLRSLEVICGFHKLQRTRIRGIPITLDGLRRLLTSCPDLREVAIESPHISVDDVLVLRAEYPDVDIQWFEFRD